jgi:hypothetical protein
MTTMTEHHDKRWLKHPVDMLIPDHKRQRYYAEVPAGSFDEQSRLIEQVIQFALDTLGAYHLDVRVISIEQGSEA